MCHLGDHYAFEDDLLGGPVDEDLIEITICGFITNSKEFPINMAKVCQTIDETLQKTFKHFGSSPLRDTSPHRKALSLSKTTKDIVNSSLHHRSPQKLSVTLCVNSSEINNHDTGKATIDDIETCRVSSSSSAASTNMKQQNSCDKLKDDQSDVNTGAIGCVNSLVKDSSVDLSLLRRHSSMMDSGLGMSDGSDADPDSDWEASDDVPNHANKCHKKGKKSSLIGSRCLNVGKQVASWSRKLL